MRAFEFHMWISVNCCDSDQESSVFSVSCLESIPNEESLYRGQKLYNRYGSLVLPRQRTGSIIGGAWLSFIPIKFVVPKLVQRRREACPNA